MRCQRCAGLGSSRHSSYKFFGTSPNDLKIVASSKFPVFGPPLRLNESTEVSWIRSKENLRRYGLIAVSIGRGWDRPERSHSPNFDHRRRPETLRTAIATAFFCPTSTTSRLPRVTPV